ncbi:hypothetical protein LQZ21_14735 [Treponema sp. TIM-1]|uniref:DUF6657 family protein n=1 Tax=Treponema sp. TIM-1 TaxID=2898417 RepID=UPI003980FF76
MGRIKSALEIALERTESVRGDKASIDQFEAKQRGKRVANEFLAGTKVNLGDEIKKAPPEQQESLKQGVFDVLLSQITLPRGEDDLKRLEAVGKGLSLIIGDSRFSALYKQLNGALSQYLDESSQYEEALRRQYAPRLRQKEEELSRRLGRRIELDPFQDAEFVAFYNQNMATLKGNYEAAMEEVREQALRFFNRSIPSDS